MRKRRIGALLLAGAALALRLNDGAFAAEERGHGAHWEYDGDGGPAKWGDLAQEFATCKTGKTQSPVDIGGGAATDLKPIEFNYSPGALEVLNNGHTVQVPRLAAGAITLDGKTYDLQQFHFHAHSEHTLNGKPTEMELHLVHKNMAGELAVVGVLMKEGKPNPALAAVAQHIPKVAGEVQKAADVKLNAADLLPASRGYYHYMGSLTTPPCSEGVHWLVLKAPIEVSKEQIAAFTAVMHQNARPVQPLNSRTIQASK